MQDPDRWRRRAPLIGGAVLVAALAGLMVLGIRHLMAPGDEGKQRVVQSVTVIRPPPPPPEEPPPPPPPEEQEEPLPEEPPPEAPAPDASPAETLGLDAEGTAGGDAFGLAARPGGRDLIGGSSNEFAWYGSVVRDRLLERLGDDPKVRRKRFSAHVRIEFDLDGTIRAATLAETTGDAEVDAALRAALDGIAGQRLRESPPVGMPGLITLRVVSRT